MAQIVLEAPETPETTPAEVETTQQESVGTPEVPESPETHKEIPESETPKDSAPQEFEIDGEKLTAAQIKEWKEKYGRDSGWIQKNESRSAELNRQEEELRQLRLIKPYLEQRPDIIQQLLQPTPQRNYDAELQQLYSQKPDQFQDPQGFANWEYRKDLLVAEKATNESSARIQQDFEMRSAYEHNARIDAQAKEKYGAKVGDVELRNMTQWIFDNVKPNRSGKYPENAYDVAFKILHEDKYLTDIKLSATQKAVAPLLNSKPSNTQSGIKPQEVQPTPEDEEDQSFVKMMRVKNPKYRKLA